MKIGGVGIAALLALLALGSDGVTTPAWGQTASAARKQVELSMVVTGSVDIDADGRVEHYALDQPEKLPPIVVQLVSSTVPAWKFMPELAEGRPVPVTSAMSLRFVARPNGDGNYNIGIRSASFHDSRNETGRASIVGKPSSAMLQNALKLAGATGDVYVAVKIGPDGKFLDGVVQQVNLTMLGTSEQMRRARRFLGQGALEFARHCRYSVSAKGQAAVKPYWTGVLPFTFAYGDRSSEDYGQWHAYVPGPRAEISWQGPARANTGVDAVRDGALTLDDSGPKLLTPLSQG
jgi:hypothetical protein